MKVIKTKFDGLIIIEPNIFKDERGYFFESYNKNKIKQLKNIDFVQDNQSKSSYGTIRGLHYQLEPYAQSKLIRVLDGKIRDVVVDLRMFSSTYGEYFSIDLSSDNKKQFFIPKGFAHGFSVLSETATVLYKTDEYYHPELERGIVYNDKKLNIDWGLPYSFNMLVSSKDLILPSFDESESNFKL